MKNFLLMVLSLFFVSHSLEAQKKKIVAPPTTNSIEQDPIIKAQNFRLIGPFRGGDRKSTRLNSSH